LDLTPASPLIRRSASVLLARSWESQEVFLALRSLEIHAFPGTHVFPGGKVDPEDGDIPVRDRAPEIDAAAYVAAARELFEEVGVLIARPQERNKESCLLVKEFDQYRRGLLAGEVSFRTILTELHLEIDGRHLIPLGEKTTPPFHPRRYRNRFFMAVLPEGQEPSIWPGELQSGDWFDPLQAAAAFHRGEMLISPPILMLCERWGARSAQEALEDLRSFSDESYQDRPLRIRFSPEVTMFPGRSPTLPPATHTNTYLLGANRLLCVDPATDDPEDRRKLLLLIDELIAEGCHIEAIVLSHHHPDHHAATALVQEHTGAPLWGHAVTATHLPHLHFDRLLEDGDEVDLGKGGVVRFLHTPGHAAGHLCLFQEKYRGLLVGDMLSTASTILIDPAHEGDMTLYLESLRKLLTLNARVLHPSHGDAFPSANVLLERYLKHRLAREEKTAAALKSEEIPLEDLVQIVYDDTVSEAWPWAKRSLEAGLIKLERDGIALQGDSGWRRA
jgi:glyoxylase-like metal-dependent hydrolase (beta-lactamase superfamily II)/8-oxo-dGTP pyrophosphatase MutT (NUDIX family)